MAPHGARAGVVLMAEAWGIDDALLGWAGRLCEEGYAVAMPDPWWRRGKPPMGTLAEVLAAVAGVVDAETMSDVADGREVLRGGVLAEAGAPVAVLGFCMGGLAARLAACTVPGIFAAVEFYGRIVYPTLSAAKPVQPLDLLPGLGCPLQCHFGEEDAVAPRAHLAELEERARRAPRPVQVLRYAGAGHAFMNPARPSYDAARAELAWSRAMAFLDHARG
jgi:carboxymethylenebutenolidase